MYWLCYGMDLLGFKSQQEQEIFPFSKMSRLIMAPTLPLFSRYQGSFLGIKWLRHDVDHSSPCRASVKNEWRYTYASLLCLHGMDRDIFNFHSYIVQFDVIQSFISLTNAQLICFKILKFTVKYTINAPTCFGLTKPSSGSLQSVLR